MPTCRKWFFEKEIPGKRFKKIKHGFFIEKIILERKTSFQKVLIFDNPIYGRIFCLNGTVQLSEKDEFIYHEMISHFRFYFLIQSRKYFNYWRRRWRSAWPGFKTSN